MKNPKLKISVSLILILAVLVIPVLSEIPDHKPVICFDCHTNGRFPYGAENEKDECGGCHEYADTMNKMNTQELEEKHNPNTCKACHGVNDAKVFHSLHKSVSGSCTRCHGENGNSIPDKTINECGGCHGGQLHVIHQGNLTGICSNCHGSRPGSKPASGSAISNNELTAGIYAKVVNYKQFTLYEIFQKILSLFSI